MVVVGLHQEPRRSLAHAAVAHVPDVRIVPPPRDDGALLTKPDIRWTEHSTLFDQRPALWCCRRG